MLIKKVSAWRSRQFQKVLQMFRSLQHLPKQPPLHLMLLCALRLICAVGHQHKQQLKWKEKLWKFLEVW
ncbi:MAG: hypothetical protein DWH74_00275 [Planctomycetota bacterium]|nr:MAG: hypothetical protein DWH74_00275 [Planctomycetota bacterium]